jgi:DNA-directed RNA polymerase specialized sigma24 family protein
MLVAFDHADWMNAARRLAMSHQDADDLLQDAVLVALRAGRTDFNLSDTRRWFAGVLKNVARQERRTVARRVKRDAAIRKDETDPSDIDFDVSTLPAASRQVATLAMAGLNRAELADALQLSDAALRQRLVVLRRALQERAGGRSHVDQSAVAADLPTGLIRRALIHALSRLVPQRRAVGTHDPDGHPIVLAKKIR